MKMTGGETNNMDFIEYRAGFKYQLHADCKTTLTFGPPKAVKTYYILFSEKQLEIKKGYAWDGPSGPTFDTKTFMRASLVHDALYQLIRMGELSMTYRKLADEELKSLCLADGMSKLRAWWVYRALEYAGRNAALPSSTKRIHRAP